MVNYNKNEMYLDYDFDENDDIILPCTVFGEIYLILSVLYHIIKKHNIHYTHKELNCCVEKFTFG